MASKSSVTPFSLKDAPSLIERVWPAQKISVEAQKERKANIGQTLTVLGAYWKGRKPLILVRACILAALLPATEDSEFDLDIFEKLLAIDDNAFLIREQSFSASETAALAIQAGQLDRRDLAKFFRIRQVARPDQAALEAALNEKKLAWSRTADEAAIASLRLAAHSQLTYVEKVANSKRAEECDNDLLDHAWDTVNLHLGTSASSLPELIEQLGIMRFGHRPRVADTFAGGCSIPFEAARIGCDSYASDLNPIACMLSWGAFYLLGANARTIQRVKDAQEDIIRAVDQDLIDLKIEHDEAGNRAKAYLYCLEVTCPRTQWKVPLIPNLIISTDRRVVGKLRANHKTKRVEVDIVKVPDSDWSNAAKEASAGTVKSGNLVYEIDGETHSVPIKTIRGDFRTTKNEIGNKLRSWSIEDVTSREDDIFRERLYCIQWITKESLQSTRPELFFEAPTRQDLQREALVLETLVKHLPDWRRRGIIPDMSIEGGDNNSQPIRERGWTYWHHLFSPRQLLTLGMMKARIDAVDDTDVRGALTIAFVRSLDRMAKLCRWSATPAQDLPLQVFSNQALNTLLNWGVRANKSFFGAFKLDLSENFHFPTEREIQCCPATAINRSADVFVTDPPYADAVNYHEITEFFIAWIRKNPPPPFRDWTWDSRRPLAIKGDGEDFRKGMVQAYKAMADHMPDNGLQIVMFTHQDAGVWGDMAQIFWGAGMRVMAAWYISTETTSELKKGGYVQGTVILVLRKRKGGEHGYRDEIVQEVKVEVADQIDTMAGLNQTLKGHGRIENLFEDADLQMAGYAAALRVLTKYTTIDGVDMTKEVLRPRVKGERDLVAKIIEFAVQVANEHMVPERMSPKVWEQLTGAERFFFKMMDIEETGAKKLDNYQNFSRAFRVPKYDDLMGSMEPNNAKLKSAKEFKKAGFEGSEFGCSKSRALLFAIFELQNEIDGDDVLSHLRDMVPDYFNVRDDLAALAEYVAKKRANIDEQEARAAAILHGLIRNERFG